jgi:hypothetical protein
MPLWHVRVRLPEGDRRSRLGELRRRHGVVVRGVDERDVTVEVGGADEAQVRRDWASATVLSVFRVDGGWSGDWWDGQDLEVIDSEYELGPAGGDTGVIVMVTERRPRGPLALAGEGRRSTVELRAPLGGRPVWDRRPGAVRPHAYG